MGRGPSYPYVGLEDAIMLASKMWDFTKRAPAPADSIVKDAWNYSPTSSSGQKIIAAMRSYGLIEESSGGGGKALKLTQRAIRILLDEKDSKERAEELKATVLSPKWYEFCWRTWGKEMPPSMRSNLLIDHGFVDTTVDNFLRDYKESIKFSGLLEDVDFGKSADGNVKSSDLPAVGDYVQWESKGVLQMPEPVRLSHYSKDGQFAFLEGSPTGVPSKELIRAEAPEPLATPFQGGTPEGRKITKPGETKMQVDTLSLADGITLQFQWPESITKDAYDDFLYQLEGFKRRVARAVKTEPKEQENDEG